VKKMSVGYKERISGPVTAEILAMGTFGKFVRLPPDERLLLVRAALLLAGVRLGLAVLPFQSVERGALRLIKGSAGARNGEVSQERLVWAVRVASRTIPGAECLAQAIALKSLLERHGYPARIRMGFAKNGTDNFAGHAWVESGGQAVLGGGPLLIRFGQ
jgi:hypothetical protein